jgi:H(+)-transporting ATP synthase subunit D
MSLTFKPTRSELTKLKRLLSIARRSSRMLREKYQMLSQELQQTKDELKKLGLDKDKELTRLYGLVDEAESSVGADRLRRAASIFVALDEAKLSWENIRGVLIPTLVYSAKFPDIEGRGYYLPETDSSVDKASEKLSGIIPALVRYANLVNRQAALSKEQKRVEIRYKALDNILIPDLLRQRKRIVSKLDEMEREDLIRLKTVKGLLERKAKSPHT